MPMGGGGYSPPGYAAEDVHENQNPNNLCLAIKIDRCFRSFWIVALKLSQHSCKLEATNFTLFIEYQ